MSSRLQELWEESLIERARVAPTSAVEVLDKLLTYQRQPDI